MFWFRHQAFDDDVSVASSIASSRRAFTARDNNQPQLQFQSADYYDCTLDRSPFSLKAQNTVSIDGYCTRGDDTSQVAFDLNDNVVAFKSFTECDFSDQSDNSGAQADMLVSLTNIRQGGDTENSAIAPR